MSTSPISFAVAHAGGESASKPALPSSQELNDMFMQLLMAQLKNQNPLNPMDPAQFVGQLAQFTELSEVSSIYELLQGSLVAGTGSGGSSHSAPAQTREPVLGTMGQQGAPVATAPGSSAASGRDISPAQALTAIYHKLQGGY